MKKGLIILLVIIILIISITAIYAYERNNKIKQIRINEYQNLRCISECPTYTNAFGVVFNETCLKICEENTLESGLLKGYGKYLLSNTDYEDFKICNDLLSSQKKDEWQLCAKEKLFPLLEEKYPYLKAK